MTTSSKLMTIGALLTIAATCASASQADTSVNPPRQTIVSYADLDLTRPAGAERLYGRLQAAVAKVCPPAHSDPIQDRVRRGACVRSAMHDAVAKVGAAELTKIHLAKTGRGLGSVLAGK